MPSYTSNSTTKRVAKTSTERRGAKPSIYVFTSEQDAIIRSYCQTLKDNIKDHLKDPNNPARDSKLTEWKKDTTEEILALPEFEDLDVSMHDMGGWRKGIKSRFTNFFHTHIKPTLHSHLGRAVSTPTTSEQDKLLRTFALLSSDLSGREFFARENAQLLRDKTDEVHDDHHHNIPKGAARNKALAQLWDDFTTEEKNQWKERAETYAMDVDSNRESFPRAIGAALQTVCGRGRIGTVVMALSYAYRIDDGGVDTGIVHAGYNTHTGKVISVEIDDPEWQAKWRKHADTVLPPPVPTRSSLISQTDDGTPVFPVIDVKKSTPDDVAKLVEDYVSALWSKASPADPHRIVLWKNINDDAAFYYDDEKFILPGKLRPAAEYDDLAELYALVKYFSEMQRAGSPFKFTRFNELSSDSEDDHPPVRTASQKRRAIIESDEDIASDEERPPPSRFPSPRPLPNSHRTSDTSQDGQGTSQMVDIPQESDGKEVAISNTSETFEEPDPPVIDATTTTSESNHSIPIVDHSAALPPPFVSAELDQPVGGASTPVAGPSQPVSTTLATKTSQARRPKKTSNRQDAPANRTLRKRGPTGAAMASTPPKRVADLIEVDSEQLLLPAKRQKNMKGYKYVVDNAVPGQK